MFSVYLVIIDDLYQKTKSYEYDVLPYLLSYNKNLGFLFQNNSKTLDRS